MALEFSGIENVGEFYSGHYLTAVLEGDLKATFAAWKQAKEEEGKRPPNEALAGLANRYFTAQARAEDESGPAERLALAQDFHAYFLEALGYTRQPGLEPLDGDEVVPVHLALRRDGNPFLWVIDAPFPASDDADPLMLPPLPEQLSDPDQDSSGACLPRSSERQDVSATWREVLDERLSRLQRPPRWVLFLAGSEALLIERHKWPQGKYLRFDLGELFGRKQPAALCAVAGLLHRDVLAPETGLCLHDTLDENSHKHAYAVSGDLKHGVRRAVELLANEAVHYRREVQKQGVFNDDEFAAKLTSESLTWLYRLLFLFYVEARGAELGAVPMQSEAYRKGYSLETLRDLELVPLTTEHARNGTFIHESLRTLFRILNMGFPEIRTGQEETLEMTLTTGNDMRIDALNSPLFDDVRLELLQGVRFRNQVLQEVLQLLSLSGEKKRRSRGRISYAQLGINQLGAVYEGLLSYTGFFATEDLYEVASEKDNKKLSGKPAAEREALKTYFVPASRIGDYKEGEIVKDENQRKVVHKKGSFIFRLAGRNREKSASYYTPEVLTRCLVKYALKELLWEEGEEGAESTRKKTADEILSLTICEPAMGSSAFLIEAVDQLADAYLEARQEEVRASGGETIPPEDYQREKRRVKARLATNNCYGVDLNPTAVELAKVSLWLATLHEDGKCPWFGLRLATGNSLVGARREVFKTADVTRKGTKDAPNWLDLVPEPVPLHHSPEEGDAAPSPDEVDWANWTAPPRPKGTIYHFLLPAEGMAAFDKDKVVKQLAPESVKRIKEWRKEFCKPFKKKDAERLEQISDAVDRLFAQVVRERVLATQETSDRIPVWGEPPSAQQADLLVRHQEEVAASLEDGSSAYRRLKLAMDAWCALWFWPIEEAELLPDRATWLAQMELILKGQVTHEVVWREQTLFSELSSSSHAELVSSESLAGDVASAQRPSAERLKRLQSLSEVFRDRRADYSDECGLADVDAVIDGDPGLSKAQRISDRLQFHHWPLRFAEVFARQGGFDLVVGNPPWVKLTWDPKALLAEYEPATALRDTGVKEVPAHLSAALRVPARYADYLNEFESVGGNQGYLSDQQNYPLLIGQQTDLYRCFIPTSWRIGNASGVVGLLHPFSIYSDGKASATRRQIYPRLRYMFHFVNQLPLFPEVLHTRRFTANVYTARGQDEARFRQISTLYHPATVAECFSHDGHGAVPMMKTLENDWELRGHRSRVVEIDQRMLNLISEVYSGSASDADASPMPLLHSVEVTNVLKSFAAQKRRLGDRSDEIMATEMWHEANAVRAGVIRKENDYPKRPFDCILSGPNMENGNPIYQSANVGCRSPLDYTEIDLRGVAVDFLPRTNYHPNIDDPAYTAKVAKWKGSPSTKANRLLIRKMLDPGKERTLSACIIPPGWGHIGGCFSMSVPPAELLRYAALFQSLVFDFFLKTTGKSNFNWDVGRMLPDVELGDLSHSAGLRVLRLNCLTSEHGSLWSSSVAGMPSRDSLTQADTRFAAWEDQRQEWTAESALRSDLERRAALLEIDVLVAMAMRMTADELVAIYRVQFPILMKNERSATYDANGRLLPCRKSVRGEACVPLPDLAATLKEQAGFDVRAEYHPDGSNTRELRTQKIRLGKKEAAVLGVSERCTMADLMAETEVRWSDEDHPEGRLVCLVGLRYTDPGLEPRMERVYPTPWTRCDREADYRQAWAEFERRLGKKIPDGTAL